MSFLLGDPYAPRDDARLLAELEELTRHHQAGCPAYARITAAWRPGGGLAGVPFLHVGLFKDLLLQTTAEGIKHQRRLASSATTSGVSSQVALDERSSALQGESARHILSAWLGTAPAPLVVLDSARALRERGAVSARLAAAMSLRPLATDLSFVLPDPNEPSQLDWDAVVRASRGGSRGS